MCWVSLRVFCGICIEGLRLLFILLMVCLIIRILMEVVVVLLMVICSG